MSHQMIYHQMKFHKKPLNFKNRNRKIYSYRLRENCRNINLDFKIKKLLIFQIHK